MSRPPPSSPLFPYTTLFRSLLDVLRPALMVVDRVGRQADHLDVALVELGFHLRHRAELGGADRGEILGVREQDRKSTRLNSSHLGISYAVFCLKKKKNKQQK